MTVRLVGRRASSGLLLTEVHECMRCGHTWLPRKFPVRWCPACKSGLWNKPRVRAEGGGRRKTGKGKPVKTPMVMRLEARDLRRVALHNRMVAVRKRLDPPTNSHLAALFGVHRNAISQWLRGQNGMTEVHYRVLGEIERKVGILQ